MVPGSLHGLADPAGEQHTGDHQPDRDGQRDARGKAEHKEAKTMTARLVILYGHPADPAAFEDYYANRHIPYASKHMPGVRQAE